MNWEEYKSKLAAGETVRFRPRGHSMEPKISSGSLVTITPIEDYGSLKKGDIVFCRVGRTHYVHLIQAITRKMGGIIFQIGNNKGRTNGRVMTTERIRKSDQNREVTICGNDAKLIFQKPYKTKFVEKPEKSGIGENIHKNTQKNSPERKSSSKYSPSKETSLAHESSGPTRSQLLQSTQRRRH